MPGIEAPVWNIRLTCAFVLGLKLAMFPSWTNVGDFHLIVSAMRASDTTEPRLFICRAERDGEDWVINGEKWFASNASSASFIIAMVITDPSVPVHKGASMFLVPTDTPGLEFVRNVGPCSLVLFAAVGGVIYYFIVRPR